MNNINDLTINPTIVCKLILRAREFHAKEQVTFNEPGPETEYEYDWAQILADHYDDMTYQEIKNALDSLTYEMKVDLLALMFLGREDFTDLQEARKAAKTYYPSNFTDFLLAHPFLANYLETALHSFNISCEEWQLKT